MGREKVMSGSNKDSHSSSSEEQDSDTEEGNDFPRNNFQVFPLCILYICMLRSNSEL